MAKYNKALYESRKIHGICTACGKSPARPNRTTCKACALRVSEYYHYHKQHGYVPTIIGGELSGQK